MIYQTLDFSKSCLVFVLLFGLNAPTWGQEKTGVSTSLPTFIDTGNSQKDATDYATRKQAWIKANPNMYKQMGGNVEGLIPKPTPTSNPPLEHTTSVGYLTGLPKILPTTPSVEARMQIESLEKPNLIGDKPVEMLKSTPLPLRRDYTSDTDYTKTLIAWALVNEIPFEEAVIQANDQEKELQAFDLFLQDTEKIEPEVMQKLLWIEAHQNEYRANVNRKEADVTIRKAKALKVGLSKK